MEDFKPNSHKFKEDQKQPPIRAVKKIEKVVTGQVKTKKKSDIKKLTDIFIAEDVQSVKTYILMDVLVPHIKKLISDVVKDGIDMILNGKTTNRSGSVSNYVSYKDYSNRDRSYDRSDSRTGYSHDDIILETRGEAEEVLSRMDELVDVYGVVSIADLYDLIGKTCNYTDNKYGWTNIRNAEPIRVRDGWMLKLPKALPID